MVNSATFALPLICHLNAEINPGKTDAIADINGFKNTLHPYTECDLNMNFKKFGFLFSVG